MHLKSVKLTHFRGYRATMVIPIDEAMTGIVGRNDYGKSTIREALAIFFEGGDVKADKREMNGFSLSDGDEQFEMACEFDDLPAARWTADSSWTPAVGGVRICMHITSQAHLTVVSLL